MSLAETIRRRVQTKTARLKARLPIAARAFADELRVVLNTPGTPDNPSKPGEAPHRVTGKLWNSIVVIESYDQGDRAVSYVGPTIFYADYLRHSRPFYEIAARRCRQKMRDLLFEDDDGPAPSPPAAP